MIHKLRQIQVVEYGNASSECIPEGQPATVVVDPVH